MHEVSGSEGGTFPIRLENIILAMEKDFMQPFSLVIGAGDVCEIQASASDWARFFLRFLSTLQKPFAGTYAMAGQVLDFSDYQSLLAVKRRVAYIATEAALLSNRSLLENILIGKAWQQNTMHPEMDLRCQELCRFFCIHDKLHLRPAFISAMACRAAIVVQGMAKNPDLILVEKPEDFVGRNRKEAFLQSLRSYSAEGGAVVFWTDDSRIGRGWATRKWILEGKSLREIFSGERTDHGS